MREPEAFPTALLLPAILLLPTILLLVGQPSTVLATGGEPDGAPEPRIVYATDVDTTTAIRYLDLLLRSDDVELLAEEASHLSAAEKDQLCLAALDRDLPDGEREVVNARLLKLAWSGPYFSAPPVRAPEVISRTAPSYSEKARRKRLRGVVHVSAVVGTNGRARDLVVVEGEPLLAVRVLETMPGRKLRPARVEERPVAACYSFRMNFTLQ